MNPEEIKAAEEKRLADEAAAEAAKKAKENDPDAGKTAAEIEAEAKEAEEKLRAKKEEAGLTDAEKEEKKKADQKIRRDKALAKLNETDDEPQKPKEISVDDKVFLGVKDIDPASETAKVLQKYVDAGIVKNYKEGFEHPGVKGELAAIEADKTAKSVIDENGSEDAKLATKKERIANYRASGEVPSDANLQKEIAEANLAEMGLR